MGLEGLRRPPVKVTRREGWDIRLRELIDAARQRPFEYGIHDCSTFAMIELPRALSGDTPDIGIKWTNEAEALALLNDRSLEYYATQAFGEPVEGWKHARRGDFGLLATSPQTGNMPLLAVVIGAMAAVPGPHGLTFVKTDRLEKIWRLG